MEAAWLDAEGADGTIVCQVRPGCCLRMSPSAYWIFANLRDGRRPDEIAMLAERAFGSRLDTAELARVCDDIVARVDEQTRLAEKRRRRRYLFRIRILSEAAVGRLAGQLHRLFSRPAFLGYAGLIAAAVGAQLASGAPEQLARHFPAGSGLLAAYLIYLLALALHELGHAAACSRYGVRPGSIGFAVYLAFPALYCDVTRAWLLPRRQRVVVDISGLVFEVGAGAGFALAGGVLGQPVFTLAAFFVLGNLVWVLNPFGRFDMYWTLADALGVTNLRSEGWRVLRGLLARGPAAREGAAVRRWRRALVAGYGACSLFMIGLFGYYALRISILMVPRLPLIIRVIGDDTSRGHIGAAVTTALEPVTMLTLLGVMLYRAAAAVIRAGRRPRRSADRDGD